MIDLNGYFGGIQQPYGGSQATYKTSNVMDELKDSEIQNTLYRTKGNKILKEAQSSHSAGPQSGFRKPDKEYPITF